MDVINKFIKTAVEPSEMKPFEKIPETKEKERQSPLIWQRRPQTELKGLEEKYVPTHFTMGDMPKEVLQLFPGKSKEEIAESIPYLHQLATGDLYHKMHANVKELHRLGNMLRNLDLDLNAIRTKLAIENPEVAKLRNKLEYIAKRIEDIMPEFEKVIREAGYSIPFAFRISKQFGMLVRYKTRVITKEELQKQYQALINELIGTAQELNLTYLEQLVRTLVNKHIKAEQTVTLIKTDILELVKHSEIEYTQVKKQFVPVKDPETGEETQVPFLDPEMKRKLLQVVEKEQQEKPLEPGSPKTSMKNIISQIEDSDDNFNEIVRLYDSVSNNLNELLQNFSEINEVYAEIARVLQPQEAGSLLAAAVLKEFKEE